jgi:hypothetical protein
MYNPMEPAPTPVSAWIRAARRLKTEGDQHGLMLHVENPIGLLQRWLGLFEQFLGCR